MKTSTLKWDLPWSQKSIREVIGTVGLLSNVTQHGMIFVGLGMMASANRPEEMNTIAGPGPDAHNRVGSFIGPMAASFQVKPPEAPHRRSD